MAEICKLRAVVECLVGALVTTLSPCNRIVVSASFLLIDDGKTHLGSFLTPPGLIFDGFVLRYQSLRNASAEKGLCDTEIIIIIIIIATHA